MSERSDESASRPIERLLVAGCGDLGTRVALLAAERGATVFGLRRDPSGLPAPIVPLAGDLASGPFELPDRLDSVVLAVAPSRSGGPNLSRTELYERTYLASARSLVAALVATGQEVQRLVFTSSTSVYGEDEGGAVDERSSTGHASATGRVLVATEDLLAATPFRATSLRLSGLYGPGRTSLVERVRSGAATYSVDPERITNRIHVDDAARAVVHLLTHTDAPTVVCGTDREPVLESTVLRWLAERLGVEPPRPSTASDAQSRRGEHTRGAGKRVSSALLVGSGFEHRYPTFREGYAELLH
ncbi:NAD dependent epimerase/dehydratase family protein [Planctomycetes bacterium Pla163]|uniref:NAD dependent epimerase/dehydratase family protein n=1 Tax=Rohdeia mirabilis TaxID=2528008 RepID=A0A518CYE9_9BACT|nr:NAD dependent epimerase/dehydratase family protein [Planctomycetes bacterium Pla163]